MDPISLAKSTLAIVAHGLNTIHRANEVAEAKSLLLSIDISLLRLQKWQELWFQKDRYTLSRAEELWGKDGSEKIGEMILSVNQSILGLSAALGKVTKKETDTPDGRDGVELPPGLTNEVNKAFRDMDQRKRGHRHFVKFFKKSMLRSVQDTTRQLSSKVDQLEQLSHLSYQIVHGLRALKNHDGFREYVLRSSNSRQGALNLWEFCRWDTYQWSLGMDMLLDKGVVMPLHIATQSNEDGALCYRLLWTMNESYGFMKLTDTLNPRRTSPRSGDEELNVKSHLHELSLQNPKHHTLVNLSSKYSKQNSRFRVDEIDGQKSSSDIVRYSKIQGDKKPDTPFSMDLFTSLTVKEKLKLAYKLTECGAELLGTPWFASLVHSDFDLIWEPGDASKMHELQTSLQRTDITSTEPDMVDPRHTRLYEKYMYILDVPRINIDDMMVQDSGVLAEHNQLFSLGVVLIRLALGPTFDLEPEVTRDRIIWASEVLPRVRRELGSQYAEACAFCVGVPRKGHWESCQADKYSRIAESESWREYLERFIGDFYSEVYLK